VSFRTTESNRKKPPLQKLAFSTLEWKITESVVLEFVITEFMIVLGSTKESVISEDITTVSSIVERVIVQLVS